MGLQFPNPITTDLIESLDLEVGSPKHQAREEIRRHDEIIMKRMKVREALVDEYFPIEKAFQ